MRWIALKCLAAACGGEVDPAADGLPSIADYETWTLAVTAEGPLAGHGDSVRVIYANPVARNFSHSGRYQNGSVLVKEVYRRNDDGTRGTLRYLAIMRKVGDDAQISAPVEGGWVWTTADDVDAEEYHSGACWATCHIQAAHDGAWIDYGQ